MKILITVVITGLVVFLVMNSQGKTSQNSPPAQPQVQSMDDHHKPKAADSSIFETLTGKEAPDFTLEDYEGKKITLSSLKGKNVLLFFNEGLMCYPACWNQIAAFGKDKRFNDNKTITFSIVIDQKSDWKQAIDKMPELAGVPVLFDLSRTVSQAYGVLTLNSSMHRGQFPGHTYILINKEGIVRKALDDIQMAVRNDELAQDLAKL